jgi:hypothetical protein
MPVLWFIGWLWLCLGRVFCGRGVLFGACAGGEGEFDFKGFSNGAGACCRSQGAHVPLQRDVPLASRPAVVT